MANYRFPGRNILAWGLLAPLAVPSFIAAYAYVELLEYAGPVQTALRAVFGWEDARSYWFPEIRSMGGAAVAMTFAFYPYTYLLARAAFHEQSASSVEASRSLGCGPLQSLWRVALPPRRPAIAAGVSLALMETLADFGTVEYFAVQTLTVGIFAIWLQGIQRGRRRATCSGCPGLVIGLLAIERAGRRNARYHDSSSRYRPGRGRPLHGWTGILACSVCMLPTLIGFAVPVGVLGYLSLSRLEQFTSTEFLLATLRTATVAGLAALLAVFLMLILAYGVRSSRSADHPAGSPRRHAWIRRPRRRARRRNPHPAPCRGQIPLFPWRNIGTAARRLHRRPPCCLCRPVRCDSLWRDRGGICPNHPAMETVARTLGADRGAVLRRIQVPLLRSTLISASLLVFVETAKELPATLILRPFGYDTLATLTYSYASLEQVGNAAPAALAVIATGLLPALLFRKHLRRLAWSQLADQPQAAG